ncbi:hypothetical protein HF325_002221 [Metschnikowia pulcherrima]|uniref:Transcriptional regulatory protein DEP1 n=1 Tax=Metschnikowia pulcherrima TaxID=27326 RepID=A0A8H7GV86_9ASCO|nr:hypothetical protein HF325_002221 [Metschnikowia pulcherrima]
MPGLDRPPLLEPVISRADYTNSPVLTEENLKFLESPSPLSADYPQTKDSPLTDIGTSPPPFEIPSLGEQRAHSRDSYESSELSDLDDDDDSEAETDKMDFLNEDAHSRLDDRDTDLQRLSDLTTLANLQDLDTDDSDDGHVPVVSANQPESSEEAHPGMDEHESEQIADGVSDTPSAKRQLDAVSDAESDAKDLSSTETEPSDMKRRKLNEDIAPEDAMLTEDPTLDYGVKPESSVVQEIIENGAEPLSWPEADSVVTAITPMVVTKEDEPLAEDAEGHPIETAGASSEVEADEGVGADVEDTVKHEHNEEDEEEEKEEDGEELMEQSEEATAVETENGSRAADSVDDVDLDEQRKSAVEELISIENDFSFLRDKLYRDKLSLLEHEMQLCLDGSHPELLQIYYKVNEFYQDNLKLANATLNYSLKCINTETIATRTSIHQNFMKNLAGTRNEMITETTSSWYKINKEWNYLELAVADYNFTAIPSSLSDAQSMPLVANGSSMDYYQENSPLNKKLQKQSTIVELVHRRNCVNAQLGILDGLKEFHGIPSAVTNSLLDDDVLPVDELLLRKASLDEIKDDLQAMGIY